VMAVPADNATLPPRKLYGARSKELWAAIQQLPEGGAAYPVPLEAYKIICTFFMYRLGMEDLWGLLATIRGEILPPVPKGLAGAGRKVFHERELVACQKSKALELASTKGGMGIVGKQEERLLKAAQIMLRVGDIRSYCRFTAQAGHWERAICIAPAVSQKFWADLCNEYIETLSATTDIEECAPFWIATGKADLLIDACIERSELDKAFVIAKTEADGLLPSVPQLSAASAACAASAVGDDSRLKLEAVAANLAQLHSDSGEPLQASMCLLAVSQGEHAASLLSRSHEPVLAYVVCDLLGLPKDPVDLKLLAQCMERDSRWDAAGELLRQHPSGPTLHLPLLAARCPDKELAMQWSGWSAEQYQQAIPAALECGDMPSAVLSAVCAAEHTQAAEVGVEALTALLQRPEGWSIAEARSLMDPLECLPLQDMAVKDIANVLAFASYLGLVEASENNYHELVFPLAQTLRNIVMHQNLRFPVTMAEVTMLEATTTASHAPASSVLRLQELLASGELPEHLHPVCHQHIAEIQAMPTGRDAAQKSVYRGLGRMAGAQLPTCYKRYAKTSVLTNALIKGPAFELEDRKLHVSLPDALAWARVNAFSPLNTGCKITPV